MKLEASIMKSFIHFLVLFSLMWQIKADCDVEVAEEEVANFGQIICINNIGHVFGLL